MGNLILLSGGMDSALCLHKFGAELAVCFDYGQPHVIEMQYAERIAKRYGIQFDTYKLPCLQKSDDIVFVGRNALMLAFAVPVAALNGMDTVLIGCNADDAKRFPDCRPEFISNMDSALRKAYGVGVCAPLINATKAQIVSESTSLGLPETWTCYEPTKDGRQCGNCYSCKGLQSC